MKMGSGLHYLPISCCECQFYSVPLSFLLPSSYTTCIHQLGWKSSFGLDCPFTNVVYQSTFYHCGKILEITAQEKNGLFWSMVVLLPLSLCSNCIARWRVCDRAKLLSLWQPGRKERYGKETEFLHPLKTMPLMTFVQINPTLEGSTISPQCYR